MKLIRLFLVSLSLLLLSPVSSRAAFFQSASDITLNSDRIFDESVFVSADNLTVESTINGDLYCAGKQIKITGTINGNIYCAGQSLFFSGLANGSLHLAGRSLDISGIVNKNTLLAGQSIATSSTSELKSDLLVAGQSITLNGPLSRDLLVAGQSLNINSLIDRNATLAIQTINFGPSGQINGNLDYYYDSAAAPSIDSTKILGKTTSHPVDNPSRTNDSASQPGPSLAAFGKIVSLLSTFLIGLTLIYFTRRQTSEVVAKLSSSPLISFLIGFAVIFLTPLLFVLLLLTLIGIPLAFILLLVYLTGLLSALAYVSIYLGRFLFTYLNPARAQSLHFSLFLGALLLWLLTSLPGVGFFITFIALTMGTGAFFTSFLPQKESLTTA